MESTIVIKVKYEETLRRFTARVYGNEFDLHMSDLTEKVIGLFNFPPDADLVLTYIDEDGDVVTLVDEEDLRDVVRQSLNPLRITVKLNTEKAVRSYPQSSGSSTPIRSPSIQNPLPNLNSSVAEILKSVPEPFREGLAKLSLELASKAAISAPGLTQFVESFSNLGQSFLNPASESHAAAESGLNGTTGSNMGATILKDPRTSQDDGAISEGLPNLKFQEQTSKNTKDMDHVKVNIGVGTSITPSTAPMNLNVGLLGDSFMPGYASPVLPVSFKDALNNVGSQKLDDSNLNGKVVGSAPLNFASLEPKGHIGENRKDTKKSGDCHLGLKSVGVGASTSSTDSVRPCDAQTMSLGGGISKQSPFHFRDLVVSHGLNQFNECPFSGIPLAVDPAANRAQLAPRLHPFKRSSSHSDGMGGIFHRGVRCDGCGIHPITGPRFKSKIKEDYDLCCVCFEEMGNETEYIRMDRPASYRPSWSFKGLHDPQTRMRPPPPSHVMRSFGLKIKSHKLDSRFIRDVNVLDGTVMAPSTPFTKLWRMRNNGSIIWPQGTQLVWIGGDKLSDSVSVGLEISADGLPPDHELDVAVEFTAPELPGRYISYWRMAAPSGQKFGQRVWVLIQVDAALKDSVCDGLRGLNLNLPPDSNIMTGPPFLNVSVEPAMNDSLLGPGNSNRAFESAKPMIDEHANKNMELNFPINDNLVIGSGPMPMPIPSKASTSVSYPIIDLTEDVATAPSIAISEPKSTPGIGEGNDVEQTLLRELEEMGFKQVDLNKEILKMNEYNLEQSVDDLCGVAEWDPILEELQEMGFCDKEMNKKLLKKNNGSIKRVVMDLIAGEN